MKISEEELATMILEIDEDKNGEIEFDEFLSVVSQASQASVETPFAVKKAFAVFARSTKQLGSIRMDSLVEALTMYGNRMSAEEAALIRYKLENSSHFNVEKQVLQYERFVDYNH
jgi:Ca2+-binding EF-hand superfamily protein